MLCTYTDMFSCPVSSSWTLSPKSICLYTCRHLPLTVFGWHWLELQVMQIMAFGRNLYNSGLDFHFGIVANNSEISAAEIKHFDVLTGEELQSWGDCGAFFSYLLQCQNSGWDVFFFFISMTFETRGTFIKWSPKRHWCCFCSLYRWISWGSERLHQAGSRGSFLRRLLQVANVFLMPTFINPLPFSALLVRAGWRRRPLADSPSLSPGLSPRTRDGMSGRHCWSLSRSSSSSILSWCGWKKQVAVKLSSAELCGTSSLIHFYFY